MNLCMAGRPTITAIFPYISFISYKGGAKDINTFRKQLDVNALPDVSTVTYEGLFNEYYFDTLTNIKNDDEKQYSKEEQLIIPTYCFAKCKPPRALRLARELGRDTAPTST
eukprot:831562_1